LFYGAMPSVAPTPSNKSLTPGRNNTTMVAMLKMPLLNMHAQHVTADKAMQRA
jgi:hypothetical protein